VHYTLEECSARTAVNEHMVTSEKMWPKRLYMTCHLTLGLRWDSHIDFNRVRVTLKLRLLCCFSMLQQQRNQDWYITKLKGYPHQFNSHHFFKILYLLSNNVSNKANQPASSSSSV